MWDSVSQWPSEQSVAQNETQNSNLKHRLIYGAEPQLKLEKLPPEDTDTQLLISDKNREIHDKGQCVSVQILSQSKHSPHSLP